MTIQQLINELNEYAEDNPKGFDAEVRSYVGMSRQAAEERLKECKDDEYSTVPITSCEYYRTHREQELERANLYHKRRAFC